MVNFSVTLSAALLVAAVGPVVARPAHFARAVAAPVKAPVKATSTTSSAHPAATTSAADLATAKTHAANSKAMLEWVLKEAIKICHKNSQHVLCLETLGSFYFGTDADEDKAVKLESLITKFEPAAKPPPGVKKTKTTTTTTTTTTKTKNGKNNNPQKRDAFTDSLNALTSGKNDPTVKSLKQKRDEASFAASLLGAHANDPVVAKIKNSKRDAFTDSLNALTSGKNDPTVKSLKQVGVKRDEASFAASLLGSHASDPVVANIKMGKRAATTPNPNALRLLKTMKNNIEDICAKMRAKGIKDLCYMKIGSLLFAPNVDPEDKAANIQGLITSFEGSRPSRRDFDEELEARDFDDELEARDFDEDMEARDFDEELFSRSYDLDIEDLD